MQTKCWEQASGHGNSIRVEALPTSNPLIKTRHEVVEAQSVLVPPHLRGV